MMTHDYLLQAFGLQSFHLSSGFLPHAIIYDSCEGVFPLMHKRNFCCQSKLNDGADFIFDL